MDPETFLDFVRLEFAPLAGRHGLRELAVRSSSYAYKALVFSNGQRAVQFDLDVRDGYLDVFYADASIHESDGSLAEPAIQSFTRQRSVGALLRPEGIGWPDREHGLFDPGVLEMAVRDLIDGIARHSSEVFGQ
jgi:hypothetical protein